MTGLDAHTHARTTDPDTSQAAAHEIGDSRQTMIRHLLRAYSIRPSTGLTAEEAADWCRYTAESGAWKRVSDLAQLGWIEDTGSRRTARSGRGQMVRRITLAGVRARRDGLA